MPAAIFYLLVSLILVQFPFNASADSKTFRIEKVTVIQESNADLVQLDFKSTYQESISYHFDSGMVRITLPHTEFVEALEEKIRVNDKFLDSVRLSSEGLNTIVTILFADRDFQATGRILDRKAGSILTISVYKSDDAVPAEPEPEFISTGESGAESSPSLSFSDDLLASSNVTVSIVKMLVALSAILLFFYGLLWAYNRFFVRKFSFRKGDHLIKMVSSYHISPKQKIIVLNVDNKTFACGVTSNNINLISEIKDDSFDQFVSGLNHDENKEVDFSRLRTQYLESKIANDNTESAKTTTTFASELMNKVKKLKPID